MPLPPMKQSAHSGRLARTLMLLSFGILVGLLYYLTTTSFLTEDSVDYATAVLKGSIVDLLHPHHLLYNPFLALLARSFAGSPPGRADLRLLQDVNIFFSLAFVLVFFLLLRALRLSFTVSLWTAAALAMSRGLWIYSSQIEVYNATALFVTATLWCLLLEESGKPLISVLGPTTATLSMLFHQTAIFFIAAIAAYVWFRGKPRPFAVICRYVLVPLGVVGALYSVATFLCTRRCSPGAVWYFVTSYAHSGWWGKIQEGSPARALLGLLNTVLPFEGFLHRAKPLDWFFLALVPAGFALLFLPAFRTRRLISASPGLYALCLPWIGLHSLFVLWWYPENIEFWILLLPAFALLLASLFENVLQSVQPVAVPAVGLVLVLIGEFATNLPVILENRRTPNTTMEYSIDMCRRLNSKDMILTTGQGPLASYLRYFCDARVVSIHGFYARAGDASRHHSTQELASALDGEISAALAAGGCVVLEDDVWTGAIARTRDLFGLDVAELLSWLHQRRWIQHHLGHGDLYASPSCSEFSIFSPGRLFPTLQPQDRPEFTSAPQRLAAQTGGVLCVISNRIGG